MLYMNIDKEIFSETLRKIREGKGLKQLEITTNLMSRTTYSKVERGIMAPGIENFYNIVSRLNIGFEEFFYIYHDYHLDDRWEIINKFKQTRGNFDIDKLSTIIKMCENFLKLQEDNHIHNISKVCAALLKLNSNDFEEAKVIAALVWEDLSKRNTWYFDDIFLVNNIFFLFDDETVEEMYKRAINNLMRYKGFQDNLRESIEFSLQLNKFTYGMFYKKSIKENTRTLNDLILRAQELRYYDIKAVLYVRKGLLQLDESLITKGLNILEVLDLKELLKSAHDEIDIYLSECT